MVRKVDPAGARPARLQMTEETAQAVTLARAVEELDRGGVVWSHDRRREATAAALDDGDEATTDWLARRARALVDGLAETHRWSPRLLAMTRPGRGLVWPVGLLAFALGIAANALGGDRTIHVLAVPLLAILAWNVVSLLLLVVGRWLPLGLWQGQRPLAWLEGLARRWLARVPGDDGGVLREAFTRYLERWLEASSPLAVVRVRRLLHLGALALVSGAVAGMYFRGLVFEYRASWESTFLGAEAVDRLARAVLTPASWLSGIPVPSTSGLDRISAPAGPWIHLYAITAALVAGVPRVLALGFEHLRCLSRRRRVPVDVPEAYLRRLRSAVATRESLVEVLPYSHRPAASAAAALHAALLDLLGARTEVRQCPALAYGELPPVGDRTPRCRVVLFSLAQTPELEVHGELLGELRDETADGQLLLVVIDGEPYRRRLGESDAERRIAERRGAWDRVVSDAGLVAVHLELVETSGPVASEVRLERLAAGVWPEGALS